VFLEATDGTIFGPVIVAERFGERFRGLRPRAAGRYLLLPTNSVHGFGMREPIWAAGLSDTMTVTQVAIVAPRRVITLRGAVWILEGPVTAPRPVVGATLVRTEVQR